MNKQQKIKHWQNIFEQQKNSDLTIIKFCRDNKINVSTFYAWRKRLSDKVLSVKQQHVIPFVIHEQALTQPSMIKITTPTGYQLDFESTLMPHTLSQLQGNRILLPKNKLCSEFIGPASHFEFASHAGFLGV